MRLKVIITGIIIGILGYAANYFKFIENQYYSYGSYGAIGIGIILILVGLFMRRRI